MENAKALLDKILGNEITAFFFVVACSVGAVIGIAGAYWATYQVVILLGAY